MTINLNIELFSYADDKVKQGRNGMLGVREEPDVQAWAWKDCESYLLILLSLIIVDASHPDPNPCIYGNEWVIKPVRYANSGLP